MKATTFFKAASLLSTLFVSADAQAATYTHPGTGITFNKYTITSAQTAGGLEWGFALPGTAGVSDGEYIGYIVRFSSNHSLTDMLTPHRKVP
jgi:cellobiose dehydrogenase (acceptor)